MAHGSKASQCKGQNCKNNPFQKEAGKRKRLHQFAENVRRNEPVAKKVGGQWQQRQDFMDLDARLHQSPMKCNSMH